MKIRRATPDDAQALARIHIDSWRSAYRGLVPDAYLDGLDYESEARNLRHALAAETEETYCVEEKARLLAFVTLSASRDPDADPERTGEIRAIYVAPQDWHRGIGRALYRYAEDVLRSRGYGHATLWVFEQNAQARRFYEAVGFTVDGAVKTLCRGDAPLKAVRYGKALANVGAESSHAP
jgi:ribosomal protein S18 acetylase RimI-like enzyme